MSNRNRTAKTPKHQSKMFLKVLSPVGAPKSCERERYYLSCDGIDETMSERGGENHAR